MSSPIESANATYTENTIDATYAYQTSTVTRDGPVVRVQNTCQTFHFRTERKVPKTGMLLVGLGGNNGTTVTGALLAHKHKLTWSTKEGKLKPNFFGSVVQASTVNLGNDSVTGEEVYVPLASLVPTVNPVDLVVGGWDISGFNMARAMERAKVLDYDLQRQLAPLMEKIVPLPSIYYPDFIAANQDSRADNVIAGTDKWAHVEHLRADIRKFKSDNKLDKVVVCWTANTERFAEIIPGINDTATNLLAAIKASHPEVSPSTVFAVACILEGVPFINGSPQNTFVPGCIQLAEQHRAVIAGDDFKSGQTKIKSVLVDFLVNAGIKPLSIASYNHLGNNDGKNLSSAAQFRSKEISKSNVVDDMVASNQILYQPDEHPDHLVVIKYLPTVGDSKRALDEYTSEIFMGGRNTINLYNVCEDSLLASPLILDLVVLTELFSRVTYKEEGQGEFTTFHSVLSILSYLLKAPLVQDGTPVINSLSRQRAALVNLLKALVGLNPDNDLLLQHKIWPSKKAGNAEE